MPSVPVEDRLAIQELSSLYAYYCDTGQYDKPDQLFAEDCIFDESIIGQPIMRGRAAVKAQCAAVLPMVHFMIHVNCNHVIHEFNGDTASGTVHLHVECEMKDGTCSRILGYYSDDYVKVGNQWLFKQRTLVAIAPIAA